MVKHIWHYINPEINSESWLDLLLILFNASIMITGAIIYLIK